MTRATRLLLIAAWATAGCQPNEETLPDLTQRMVQGELVTPDGIRLHYEVLGEGSDTVVLVHGTPASMYSLAPDFARLSDQMTLITYDQRGGGRSELVSDEAALAWEHHVQDLEAVRAHFGLPRIKLIGISWGCYISALYAREFPDRIGRIVLFPPRIDRGATWPSDVPPQLSPIDSADQARAAELRSIWDTASNVLEVCEEFWSIQSRGFTFDPDAPSMQGSFCNEPLEALRQTWWANAAKMSSISGYDFEPVVAEINAPILVIKGTEDGLPAAWIQPWAFSAPNGRLLWIEEAGYAVWIEAADRVFPAILEFIAGEWPDGAVEG